jgi:hypothetical protein
MFKKLFGVVVLAFLLAIAIPAYAQRYDSCNRGGGRSHASRYDRGRDYRSDYGRRNYRRASYGGNYYRSAYYAPAYYPQSYYVVRRPARRVYSSYYGYPRYRRSHRSHISFNIGF